MKQFKVEWQNGIHPRKTRDDVHLTVIDTVGHLITQHNALCDYLEKRETTTGIRQATVETSTLHSEATPTPRGSNTITLPKPEWYKAALFSRREAYERGIRDASKALGVIIKLED